MRGSSRDEAGRDRLRARRDDRLGEAHDLRPSAVSTRTVLGEVNWPSPVTTVTLRCFASPVRPPVRRLTTLSFQPRIASRSNVGGAESDAMGAHRRGFVDHFGDMQQRLRGDAADVEADAAQRLALVDQHDCLCRGRRRGRRRYSRRGRRRAPGCRIRGRPSRRCRRRAWAPERRAPRRPAGASAISAPPDAAAPSA